jgi:hypothetical protein
MTISSMRRYAPHFALLSLCFCSETLAAQARRQVTSSPGQLIGSFVRDHEGKGNPNSIESMELSAVLLNRADYPENSVAALLDSLEAVALSKRAPRLRAIATMNLSSSGSRDALHPRAGTVARLERVYRRTDNPEVRATVVSGLSRSVEHRQAIAFLRGVAIKPAHDYPGAPVAALAAIASHGEAGSVVLRQLDEAKAVQDPEARQWLSLVAARGYRMH